MKIFENLANLKASKLTAGQLTSTKGFYQAGDGGGATYLIKTSADYGGTPDEYRDHTLSGGTIAVLQIEGLLNVQTCGATGNGVTNDTAAIQAAIDAGSGEIIFPSGVYLVSSTLHITKDNVTLVGTGRGSSKIIADASFSGDGSYIANTMIEFNTINATGKLFFCGIRDITIDGIQNNANVSTIVHANWMHHFNVDRVRFYGGVQTGGFQLVLTSNSNSGTQWAMYNTIQDCDFTYCAGGILVGATGFGSINASQIERCRIGGNGAANTNYGIKIETGYSNSISDNDIESCSVGISSNESFNTFAGNLCEQNTTDFESLGYRSILLGNEFNVVDSFEEVTNLTDHGKVQSLFFNNVMDNLVVDGQFNTTLYNSSAFSTSLATASGEEVGRHIMNFTGGASVTNLSPILVNTKGGPLNGWYTFTFRAKVASGTGGLYIKLPSGHGLTSFRGCSIKSGTSDYLEFREVNYHTFVAGKGRSGALDTTYRTYMGSVYFDDTYVDNITSSFLQFAAQTVVGFSVEYVGLFKGLNGGIPCDSTVLESYIDISSKVAGNSPQILHHTRPDSVGMKVTSYLTGSVDRSINQYYFTYSDSGSTVEYPYHTSFNSFGYDSAGTPASDDHIILEPTFTRIRFFVRTASLAGTDPLYTRIEFV